jgi:hypothetical protein
VSEMSIIRTRLRRRTLTRRVPATICLSLFLIFARLVVAGDAVVIGYNADRVWTAVTYYNSSTPKGGNDYKDKTQAQKVAVRDLKRRGGGQTVRTEILSDSDLTGFVAVARGQTGEKSDVTVVGRGESQQKADDSALDQLHRAGADRNQKIVYRYFSYGADSRGNL